jgi:RluA family pseudouridine synthase
MFDVPRVKRATPLQIPPMFTNIAAYKFARMDGLKDLRPRLLDRCRGLGLKGTILLAPEGINLFLAGEPDAVETLLADLRSLPGLADLKPKYSESATQPFSRMLVRLKKEIIAFGVPGVDPATYTSPRLEPRELKHWLDEGKPVILLDTRNDYEIKLGTFRNAIPARINHFRDFPAAVAGLPESMKSAPVVTFCTGGIRCEKATPFLEQAGFKEVYQLEGGILKYFEEVGSDHYEGECFVFDQRVGVDPGLRETSSHVCHACQTPLTDAEQLDPRFVENVSCPYCHRTDEERRRQNQEDLQGRLDAVTSPLPGSQPAENRRPLRIPGAFHGRPLIEALGEIFPHIAPEIWRERIGSGQVLAPSGIAARENQIVRAGEEFIRVTPADVEPDVNARLRVIHLDPALLVLDKPAPLPLHPCGRYHRNTLRHLLSLACHPEHPRPAHRLDANTTGVLVCARTRHFAKLLQPQFARGEVEKVYLARVHGHPPSDEFTLDIPIGTTPGPMGSREVDFQEGQEAISHFRVLRRFPDGTSLLEARPVTGRTNQLRLHLRAAGFPIVGDPIYGDTIGAGEPMTLDISSPPMCLHASRLSFLHPISGARVEFSAESPAWARD